MNKKRWMIAAFLVAFFATGIPYWLIPYGKVNLPSALPTLGLFLVCIATMLLCLFRIAPFLKNAMVIAGSVPAVVFSRVMVEGMLDPTSHNLWPFEVVIAMLVGVACALPGAIMGTLLARVIGHHWEDKET